MGFVIKLLRPFVWLWCKIWFRISFDGVRNIPDRGACIIAPNHASYADPIWITIPIKRRVYYMAWDKPFGIPVLGWLMRAFGAFPIKLDSNESSSRRDAIRGAKELLREGKALVVFPEGGRTRTGDLMPFKPGAFRLALSAGAPIVPVAIAGNFRIWPPGRLLPRPGELKIRYLTPIAAQALIQGLDNAEIKRRTRLLRANTEDAIRQALAGLLNEQRTMPQNHNRSA